MNRRRGLDLGLTPEFFGAHPLIPVRKIKAEVVIEIAMMRAMLDRRHQTPGKKIRLPPRGKRSVAEVQLGVPQQRDCLHGEDRPRMPGQKQKNRKVKQHVRERFDVIEGEARPRRRIRELMMDQVMIVRAAFVTMKPKVHPKKFRVDDQKHQKDRKEKIRPAVVVDVLVADGVAGGALDVERHSVGNDEGEHVHVRHDRLFERPGFAFGPALGNAMAAQEFGAPNPKDQIHRARRGEHQKGGFNREALKLDDEPFEISH